MAAPDGTESVAVEAFIADKRWVPRRRRGGCPVASQEEGRELRRRRESFLAGSQCERKMRTNNGFLQGS